MADETKPKKTKEAEEAEFPGLSTAEVERIRKNIPKDSFALVQRIPAPGNRYSNKVGYLTLKGKSFEKNESKKIVKVETNLYDLYMSKWQSGSNAIVAVIK